MSKQDDIFWLTETGAIISNNDYSFLSDNQKKQCIIYDYKKDLTNEQTSSSN